MNENELTPSMKQADQLFIAATSNDVETIQSLIKEGADLDHKNHLDKTALHHALELKHNAIAHLLIHGGAPTNERDNLGNTPLHIAVEKGSYETALLLIVKGASYEIRNHQSQFALELNGLNNEQKRNLIFLSALVNPTSLIPRWSIGIPQGSLGKTMSSFQLYCKYVVFKALPKYSRGIPSLTFFCHRTIAKQPTIMSKQGEKPPVFPPTEEESVILYLEGSVGHPDIRSLSEIQKFFMGNHWAEKWESIQKMNLSQDTHSFKRP